MSIYLPALVEGWRKEKGAWSNLTIGPLAGNDDIDFPNRPLPILVELFYNGQWNDITTDVRAESGIDIERGKKDRASQVGPTTIRLILNNRQGKYAPRNPNSELFGLIGPNTPVRVSVREIYEATAEVGAWPQSWDSTNTDRWVEIEAYGIIKRLNQGAKPLLSALTRMIINNVTRVAFVPGGLDPDTDIPIAPIAYWPMEDGQFSTVGASAVSGQPISVTGGVTWSSIDIIPGSAPIIKLDDSSARLTGYISSTAYSSDWDPTDIGTDTVFAFVFTVGEEESNAGLLRIFLDDSEGYTWRATISMNGTTAFDVETAYFKTATPKSVTTVFTDTSDPIGTSRFFYCEITSSQVDMPGSGRSITITILDPTITPISGISNNIFKQTVGEFVGKFKQFRIQGMSDTDNLGIGHFSIWDSGDFELQDIFAGINGFKGETVFERLTRLCEEENIDFKFIGDVSSTTTMGPQTTAKLTDLLFNAQDVDQGILYEPKDRIGLEYRTLSSLYNQSPKAQLDYTAKHLAGDIPVPVDDDENRINDVIVRRQGGSFARAVQEFGPRSIQAPPDGIGVYDEELTINIELDSELQGVAYWRLGLGTLDEPRFPVVETWLQRSAITRELRNAIESLDVGDYFTVDNMPTPDIPIIQQLVLGTTKFLQQQRWRVKLNCTPVTPYQVGTYNQTENGRYDTEYSVTSSSFTSGVDTSLTVTTILDKLPWVTGSTAPQFPLDIMVSGVHLRVTGISGASSPQDFTVQQTPINGIEKDIPIGSEVRAYKPARYAL